MSRRSNSGCQVYIAIIFIVISAIYTFFSTLMNFYTIGSHGIEQYLENITSLDDIPTLQISKIPFYLYMRPESSNIFTDIDIKSAVKYDKKIKAGQRFKYFGTIPNEKITWISIQVIDGTSIVNGYLLIDKEVDKGFFKNNEKENEFFKKIGTSEITQINSKLLGLFRESITSKYSINEETDRVRMQELINDSGIYVIDYLGSEKSMFYTNKENRPGIEELYNLYLGDNYDAWTIQLQNNYSAERDGHFKRDVILESFDSIFFKAFLILALFYLITKKSKLKCPKCNSTKTTVKKEKISKLGYTYENKDGSPDMRRKSSNKEIIQIKTSHLCNKCGNSFSTLLKTDRDI